MNEIYKIFADFNNTDKEGRVRLNTHGAIHDISENQIVLVPGMEVALYDEDEFVTSGTIEFSKDENIWVANIDWNTLK